MDFTRFIDHTSIEPPTPFPAAVLDDMPNLSGPPIARIARWARLYQCITLGERCAPPFPNELERKTWNFLAELVKQNLGLSEGQWIVVQHVSSILAKAAVEAGFASKLDATSLTFEHTVGVRFDVDLANTPTGLNWASTSLIPVQPTPPNLSGHAFWDAIWRARAKTYVREALAGKFWPPEVFAFQSRLYSERDVLDLIDRRAAGSVILSNDLASPLPSDDIAAWLHKRDLRDLKHSTTALSSGDNVTAVKESRSVPHWMLKVLEVVFRRKPEEQKPADLEAGDASLANTAPHTRLYQLRDLMFLSSCARTNTEGAFYVRVDDHYHICSKKTQQKLALLRDALRLLKARLGRSPVRVDDNVATVLLGLRKRLLLFVILIGLTGFAVVVGWRQGKTDDDAILGVAAGISQIVFVSVVLVATLGQFNWSRQEVRYLLRGRAIVRTAQDVQGLSGEAVKKQQLRILANDSTLGVYRMKNLCYANPHAKEAGPVVMGEPAPTRGVIDRRYILSVKHGIDALTGRARTVESRGSENFHLGREIRHSFVIDERSLSSGSTVG